MTHFNKFGIADGDFHLFQKGSVKGNKHHIQSINFQDLHYIKEEMA